MQIQTNTDHDAENSVALTSHIKATVKKSLGHLQIHLTRIEVHVDEVNSSKGRVNCKSCTMEARPRNHQPMIVSDKADSLHQAIDGATRKMKSSLEHLFGRLEDRHHRPAFDNR